MVFVFKFSQPVLKLNVSVDCIPYTNAFDFDFILYLVDPIVEMF